MVRAKNPKIHIIVGGPHISSMGIETLKKFDIFDVGVVFEGGLIISDLLHALEDGTPLSKVDGIVYRDENKLVRVTSAPEQIKELDRLPMPAWDLLPNFPDAYLPAIFDYLRAPVASTQPQEVALLSVSFATPLPLGQRCDTTLRSMFITL